MRKLGVLLALCLCAGCVTERGKVCARRTMNYYGERVKEGDARAEWLGAEHWEFMQDIGADTIPPEAAPLAEAASRVNATAIGAERATRRALLSFAGKAFSWLGESVPWLAPVVGFGAAAAAWLRKRKAQLDALQSSEIAGVLGRVVAKVGGLKSEAVTAQMDAEAPGLVSVTRGEVAAAVAKAVNSEI